MNVLDPGHIYLLDQLDDDSKERLIFVKREGIGYPGNVGHYPGTNLQEVLRALIDRVSYLNNQIPDIRNSQIKHKLRECLVLLEERAAERHGRVINLLFGRVEDYATCKKCGHIQCSGECK